MYTRIKMFIRDRNYAIALKHFESEFGPESEFSERSIIALSNNKFKILDPHTHNIKYYQHKLFGPVEDFI